MQLCMIAISPAIGPESGGTFVTLQVAGHVFPDHQKFYCKFGSRVSSAVSHFLMQGSKSLAIVCRVPPMEGDRREVAVHLSIDSVLFSVSGATFYYHAPLMIEMVIPEHEPHHLKGGSLVTLQLHSSAAGLFGHDLDPDSVTIPASCAFGDVVVSAELMLGTNQVRPLKPMQQASHFKCRKSLPPLLILLGDKYSLLLCHESRLHCLYIQKLDMVVSTCMTRTLNCLSALHSNVE